MSSILAHLKKITSAVKTYEHAIREGEKGFTLFVVPMVVIALEDKDTYIITERGKKSREVGGLGVLRYQVRSEGTNAYETLSRVLRIRKQNRKLWNQYLKGEYPTSPQVACRKLAAKAVAKKGVRVPRALRVRFNALVKAAAKQGINATVNFSRIGK